MPHSQPILKSTSLTCAALAGLLGLAAPGAVAGDPPSASVPPERCAGYGTLQDISLTNWESGLGSWNSSFTAVNAGTFSTPPWAVVGGLPDSRAGQAAFVANVNLGDCVADDESGVLRLLSPVIPIPAGTAVPRISIDHWFEIEPGWDGGNLRIKVNSGSFNLVPESAIELRPYNTTLETALDEFGDPYNTNPLADQRAFSGTDGGVPTGRWGQTRINLRGIANAGDSIQLRFDFGVDCALGEVGWYVDDVQFYSCAAELPPSNCGNQVINGGEQCDDGNNYVGDGCSNTCQIEAGWTCTQPLPAGSVADPSFEAGRPNPFWDDVSNNPLGTPICDVNACGKGGGTGPSAGTYWAWFGGISQYQSGSVAQSVGIPVTATQLTFDLEVPACDSAADYVAVALDGTELMRVSGSSPLCGLDGYSRQAVNISAFANGGSHDLEFYSETFVNNGGVSNFFVDVVAIPGTPSICRRPGTNLTLVKGVINNDGGSAAALQWTLSASGPSSFNGPGPKVASPGGFLPGTYNLSESGGPGGYSASNWVCVGGTQNDGDTVTIATNQAVTCTTLNNDIAPTLTVVKNLVNNNGGPITDPNAFKLKVDGLPVSHNVPTVVDFGDHTVSETSLPAYQAGTWGGNCSANGTISLALGQNATCTITNDDIAPTLKLVKTIVNDDGGTVTNQNAFGLRIDGQAVSHNAVNVVSAGNHTASEVGLTGYAASAWGGDCAPSGAITLALDQDATCTITNNDVAPALTLVKQVINDNGGTAVPANWTLTASGPTGFSGAGPNVSNGAGFKAGTYNLSESGPGGYSASAWVCVGGTQNDGDTVTLAPGQNVTCTITNNDTAPTLTVVKTIVNNNGGTVTNQNAFGLKIDGNAVLHGVSNPVNAGSHTVSEAGLAGYAAGAWGGNCNANGTINLAPGQNATCTITNDDVPPGLTLVKQVTNNSGGTALASAWTLAAAGPTGFSGPGPSVSNGAGFQAGTYNLSESGGAAGYSASAWVCVGATQNDGDTVTLAVGQSATCTITNDDLTPTLKVLKTITNDDGGTNNSPNSFFLRVNGFRIFHNQTNALPAGNHVVSEDGLPGYEASAWGGDCNPDGSLTLTLDQDAVCTITNDDIAPTLKLVKQIVNDSGGTVTNQNAFGLKIDGVAVQHNAVNEVSAGNHIVSETGLGGYQAGSWTGDCNADGSITLAVGQDATCSITNDDADVTSLVLVKVVINDSGGSALPSAWTLTATGPTGFSGSGPLVASDSGFEAGSYALSETGGAPGYTAGNWICVGGSQNGNTVTLLEGEAATCTITNDDIAPTLTVVKSIVNDNGGTVLDQNAFGLRIDGAPVSHNTVNVVTAGAHTVSEAGLSGYQPGSWSGNCSANGSINLALDQDATCTITNNDIAPSLTLNKVVTNDNGGTALPSAWTLSAAGPTPLSGPGAAGSTDVQSGPGFAAGTYTLSESAGPAGYTAGAWSCTGGSQNGNQITVALGQSATCTITNDDNAPSLTLNKVVTNDNGGTALPSAWTLSAAGPTGFSGPGPSVSNGASFDAGTYTLSESAGPAGYIASAWSCTGGSQNGNQITVTPGQSATCTITNNDSAPRLTLNKVVTNDNGGTAQPSAWTLSAAGPTPLSGPGAPGSADVQSGPGFVVGTYTLSESAGPAGYTASAWSCTGGSQNGNQITVALGQTATCTITNNDNAPSLTLNKVVTNDNGGTALPSAWTLSAAGPTPLSGPGAAGSTDVQSGPGFDAGTYTLSESAGAAGYTASAWSCAGGSQNGNQITVALGQSATCTITNNDNAPSLTLNKVVTNDNGGTALPSAWTLSAAGPTPLSGPGAPGSADVQSGPGFAAGTYTLSESGGPSGYTASAWSCTGGSQNGNQITVAPGQSATCTITNNDNAPSLTLKKVVTNDNGGTALASAWTLAAAGPSSFSGPGPSVSNGAGFKAGTYNLSESGGPAGYNASIWICVGGTQSDGDTVTLAPGQAVTCTITNNDAVPGLTLVKQVINDNGGAAVPGNWTLTASGPTGFSGAGPSVSNGASFDAGTYNLSESGGPGGYSASAWVCVGGTQNDGDTITLALGQAATCTITNDDTPTGLTLVKQVVNDNGGTALPSAWTLSAVGPTGFSGVGPSVSNGANFQAGTYNLSESGGPAGYSASAWVCVGGTQNDGDTVTLAPSQAATCTITNNDNAPSLTLVKQVINNNGGTALASAWTLNAAGPTPFSGPGPSVSNGASFDAGTYTLSESTGPAGYSASAWSCTGGSQNGNQITLTLGQSATCTITNNDNAPSLTLDKVVVNDNGGTALPSAWTLSASGGPTPISGPGAAGSTDVQSGASFAAGTYTLGESAGPAGYSASAWSCDGGSQNGSQITLTLGQSATCTITNNDNAPSLTLAKQVTNDNGGTALASAWTLVAAGPTGFSGAGPNVSNGASFDAGTYNLSESGGPAGYSASAWVCAGGTQNDGDTVTLALGQAATCTITNNDQSPGLTLVKQVINNNGGTALASAWTLTAAGPTGFSGPGPSVSNGASFDAGTYTLSESAGPAGYSASAWSCAGGSQNGNQITLTLGQSATCTITNDDAGPGLTLVKQVVNDNGGTALPSAWSLTASGPTGFSGPGPSVSNGAGFLAGTYNLSESGGPGGYTASAWVCVGGTQNDGDTVTLAPGQAATCTITNNDNAPSLTLVKQVTNNNGGNALASAWTLNAAGPTPFSGPGPSVSNGASFDAGTYNLSESGGPAGYSASAWVCVGGTQNDGDTVTLALGQTATCTITNDDVGSGLTLVKQVINDNLGTALPSAWTLSAAGPTGFSGPGPSVSSGANFQAGTYNLSESGGPTGYSASAWVCVGGTQNDSDTVTLAPGQAATCTITNDDEGLSQVIHEDGFE